MYYAAPHEPYETEKLNAMIATLEKGDELPPILVHGNQAYSGSHRIAAWDHFEEEYDIVELSDEDFEKNMRALDLDPESEVYDFELFLDMAVSLGLADGAK